jgi:hypothetical protein
LMFMVLREIPWCAPNKDTTPVSPNVGGIAPRTRGHTKSAM